MSRACTFAAILSLLLTVGSAVGQVLPVRYNATIIFQADGEAGCPSDEVREAVMANVSQDIDVLLEEIVQPGGPLASGWTRIAYLDMTDLTQECPSNWNLITTPKRTCGRSTDTNCDSSATPCPCSSAIFSNDQGIEYSEVTGRIVGYQARRPGAFNVYDHLREDIDSAYAHGVSITHGSPRQHIWTFVAGQAEDMSNSIANCPCASADAKPPPSIVGNDFFCETGVPPGSAVQDTFYSDDPLWDGDGCGPTNTCCTFNKPPWFSKELPQPTTDNIEVRLCADYTLSHEDIPVELIELYVK